MFVPFGPVTEVKLGPAKGQAFVTFKSPADAEEAEANVDLAVVDGSVVRVARTKPRA